jgi:hypothetical protein
MAWHRPIRHLCRTFAEHDFRHDERLASPAAARPWHTQRSPSAWAGGQLAAQSPRPCVKQFIDGFMADAHRLIVRKVVLQGGQSAPGSRQTPNVAPSGYISATFPEHRRSPAISGGRRNTWKECWDGRSSPVRACVTEQATFSGPTSSCAQEHLRRFWISIAGGLSSEDAAIGAGMSAPWFTMSVRERRQNSLASFTQSRSTPSRAPIAANAVRIPVCQSRIVPPVSKQSALTLLMLIMLFLASPMRRV